jgi:hypothetical protein
MVVDGTLQGEDSIATDTEKDSEEEIPKLENQMSLDGTLQQFFKVFFSNASSITNSRNLTLIRSYPSSPKHFSILVILR